jgi:hypothetical protein
MSAHVALVELDKSGFETLAHELGWKRVVDLADGRESWKSPDMDALVTWRPIDSSHGAFVIEGADAELMMADLSTAFRLLDDVEVMNEIAAATTPEELVLWVPRLGLFAEGGFQSSTLNVILGLLASEREEFVLAMAKGLCHARWRELLPALDDAAKRRPEWKALFDAARASIAKP